MRCEVVFGLHGSVARDFREASSLGVVGPIGVRVSEAAVLEPAFCE